MISISKHFKNAVEKKDLSPDKSACFSKENFNKMLTNRRIRKPLAFVIALSLAMTQLCVAPTAFASENKKVSSYNNTHNKKASAPYERIIGITPFDQFTITATGGVVAYTGTDTEVVVPEYIGGTKVTGIGGAFAGNKTIKSIVLPDTITSFADAAFKGCTSLTSINSYQATVLDNGQNKADCKYYMDYVASVPASLSSISSTAFETTSSIASFNVPASNSAFSASADGALLLSYGKDVLYRYASAFHYAGTYSLPEGITTICDFACEDARDVQGFQVPTTTKTIGAYAFNGGGNINEVTFASVSTVTNIGEGAFSKNANLHVTLPASVTNIGAYCFAYCQNIVVDISGSSLVSIPSYCFLQCDNIHSLTIPATVRVLDAYAFYGCNNLNDITFTGTLDKIGTGAFQGCNNLHSITVPSGVTTIENNTFDGCWNLTTIVLPETVKTIGDNAFADCKNIQTFVIPSSVTYISNTSFTGANTTNIDTTKNAYASTVVKGIVATPAAVTTIPAVGTKFIYGKLTYVTTSQTASGGSVKVIGYSYGNSNIKSLSIPAKVNYNGYKYKVTALKAGSLKGAKKLKKVTIGANIKSIGAKTFFKCKKLKKVTVKSKKIKSVGAAAFKGATKKAVIKVPKAKYKAYKKMFKGKGIKKIKKA